MGVKEAYKIIKENHENEVLLECFEFEDFFAFAFAENETQLIGGGFETVEKSTGKISTFNPISDLPAFFKAKKINVKKIV